MEIEDSDDEPRRGGKVKRSKDLDEDDDASVSASENSEEDDDDFDTSSDESDSNKKKKAKPKAKAVSASKSKPAVSAKAASSGKKVAAASPAKPAATSAASKRKIIGDGDEDNDDDEDVDFEGGGAPRSKSPSSSAKKVKVTETAVATKGALSGGVSSKTAASNQGKAPSSSSASSSSLTSTSLNFSSSVGDEVMALTNGPEITSETQAKKAILKYFQLQNRPYSAIQVYDNFHKRIAKSTVERALNALSEGGGGLSKKEYGAAKIFYLDQKLLPAPLSDYELSKLEGDINSMKAAIASASAVEQELATELNILLNEPLDDELHVLIPGLEATVSQKRRQFKAIESSCVDLDMLQNLIKQHNSMRSIWKTRKEHCMDLVGSMGEGTNKKTKDLIAELGIETDEEYKSICPPPIQDLKKKS
jgi:26S proteasome regulatory subunit (ATPase 3-interacting protein)